MAHLYHAALPAAALLPSAPRPPPAAADPAPAKMQRLQAVLDRFEITIAEANDLVVLEDYEIVVIADDSSSMKKAAVPPEWRTLGVPCRTRWDELKETVAEIVEIATCFSPEGIDVHFLNRAPVLKVHTAHDPSFQEAFASQPSGRTPLTEVMRRVAKQISSEKGILLFILTDGEPNGGKGPFSFALLDLVKSMRLRVQIMACTADESEVEWLNDLDYQLEELDVTDDYHAERQEVLRAGLATRFTRGDWCMKAMLGPVSRKFDEWDEGNLRRARTPECTVECNLCSVM